MLSECFRVHAFAEKEEETAIAEETYRLVDLYCSQCVIDLKETNNKDYRNY